MPRIFQFIALSLLSCAALAQPPTPESVEKLLTVTHTQAMVETMLAQSEANLRQAMSQLTRGLIVTPEQEGAMDSIFATYGATVREEMAWDKILPLQKQVYIETFTQQEVDGLIDFYQSPVGQAFIEKMPAAMQKSTALMQSRVGPMMQRMQAALVKAVADLKARQRLPAEK